MPTPLTDAINALTRYANETTGQSDTTLSDAVATLIEGYGQGGGTSSGLFLLKTFNINGEHSVDLPIDFSWFDSYPYVIFAPNLTFSTGDWLYGSIDGNSSNSYTSKVSSVDANYSSIVQRKTNGKAVSSWFKNPGVSDGGGNTYFANITTSLRFYLYTASVTMTGDFKVYGVRFESSGGDIDGLIDGTISGDYVNTVVTKILNQKFANCTRLTSVSFPNVTNCGASAFSSCTRLVTASLPKDTATSSYVFSNCTSLVTVSVPSRTDINTNFCQGCTSLETFDCNASVIRAAAFRNCQSLTTIIIRYKWVCNLVTTDALTDTPFASGGSGGTIYIPKALYDNLGTGTNDYKAQARWSVIDGYGTVTWLPIEGSIYETQYADGTPIE